MGIQDISTGLLPRSPARQNQMQIPRLFDRPHARSLLVWPGSSK